MHCANPYVENGQAFGCGQCLPCRVNKKRVWTHRLMLEASQHGDNSFVTLTYDDEHLPKDNSLDPRHVQLWLKKLRKAVEPIRLRFFLVGEYGDRTSRPHYHVALFGLPSCDRGRTDHRRKYCCESCDRIQRTWNMGGVDLGRLEPESAAYIAGYVTKKLTNKDDPYVQSMLNGRHPEFARMSRRPGIGGSIADDLASVLLEYDLVTPDLLPTSLRHGRRLLPLGSYLRNRVRERVGLCKKEVTEFVLSKTKEELRALREVAYANTAPGFKAFAFKQAIIDSGQGKRNSLEAKNRIYKKRGTI